MRDAIVPVSLVFPNGHVNRIHRAEGLTGWPAELARSKGVRYALQRPLLQQMKLRDLQASLSRAGGCKRCYLKQVRMDMHLPWLLRGLSPPALYTDAAAGEGAAGAEEAGVRQRWPLGQRRRRPELGPVQP